MKLLKSLLTIIFILISFSYSFGTHILGGEISHECLGNQYIVQLKLYRDCNGIALNPNTQIEVYSSTGCFNPFTAVLPLVSTTDVTNVCPTEPTVCSGGLNAVYGIEEYVYSDTIDLSVITNCTELIFEWTSCCRVGILSNIIINNNTGTTIRTTAYQHTNITNNHSPHFTNPPIFNTSVNTPFEYAPGVIEVDDDSIVVSLTDCYDYAIGVNSGLVQYQPGYSATQPFTASSITIDPETGFLQFIPTNLEIGVLCIKTQEYRNGVLISENIRDSQLTISNSTNENPKISGLNGTATTSGTTGNYIVNNIETNQFFCFDITTFDIDPNQNITLEHSNNLSGATYTINNSGTYPSLNVCWTPTINDIGIHYFSVIATDDNCPIIGKSVKTYRLTVLPPVTIEGQISLSNGNIYTEGVIYLMDSTKQVIDSVINSTGNYQFLINDINNNYHLSVVPNGQIQHIDKTYYNEKSVIQDASKIPITTRTHIANMTMLDTTIGIGPSIIKGIIKDPVTNLPIPNVRVVVVNSNFDYLKSSISKADGSIEFFNLTYNQDYFLWVDQLGIDNSVAPLIRFSSNVPRQTNLELKLHNTYLELLYPTNTANRNYEHKISITPNPSNGIFNLDFNKLEDKPKQINVIDISGKIIQQYNLGNSDFKTIDLTGFASQIYFLQIITDNQIIIKKISKN